MNRKKKQFMNSKKQFMKSKKQFMNSKKNYSIVSGFLKKKK